MLLQYGPDLDPDARGDASRAWPATPSSSSPTPTCPRRSWPPPGPGRWSAGPSTSRPCGPSPGPTSGRVPGPTGKRPRMADAWGIDDGYWDVVRHSGTPRPRATRQALRLTPWAACRRRRPPPWATRCGSWATGRRRPSSGRPSWCSRTGRRWRPASSLPPDLPLGYHDLAPVRRRRHHPADRRPRPGRPPPPERAGGAGRAALRAARSSSVVGHRRPGRPGVAIAAWAGGHGGAGPCMVSPLHAPCPRPSPSPAPTTRRRGAWLNPLHLRIEGDPTSGADGRALQRRPPDRPGRGVEAEAGGAGVSSGTATAADGVRGLAGRSAASELEQLRHVLRAPWPSTTASGWPAVAGRAPPPDRPRRRPLRRRAAPTPCRSTPGSSGGATASTGPASSAGTPVGLIRDDLAVGADPDGADSWLGQDVLAHGVRVGAPPDEFNGDGQDWGCRRSSRGGCGPPATGPLGPAVPGRRSATAPGCGSTM